MRFAHYQNHPRCFFDWATPPCRTATRAKGVAEKAQRIASLPTSQKDQGGARPTLSRGGRTQESRAITHPTKARNELARTRSPPPLLYVPPSPPPHPTTRPTTLPMLGSTLMLPFNLINVPHHIIAGRLQHFIHNWMILTKDVWIHSTIKGFHILLKSSPTQTCVREMQRSKESEDIVNQELQALLDKKIITPIAQSPTLTTFLSPIFTIPKKNGEQRLIINLRQLNKSMTKQHFKMEGAHLLSDLLVMNDWMVKVDLKEAYYAVPIHQQSQSLLGFLWNSRKFQFTCLPFGLSCAPRVFTKILKPVVAYLRERSVRLISYIDDILIMAPSEQLAKDHLLLTLDLLEILGFLINYPKCVLHPTQNIDFLGFVVNSREMKLYLPREKMATISKEAAGILNSQRQVSGRELARMIGLLSATIPAVLPAPLHYRNLQCMKNRLVLAGGYKNTGPLTSQAQTELKWWLQTLANVNGRTIKPRLPDRTIFTNASNWGWGAASENVKIGGAWNSKEVTLHINCLELLAAWYATQAFVQERTNQTILLWLDNRSAVAYINHMGGTHSSNLADLAIQFWNWALKRSIFLVARHIAGKENVSADQMSHSHRDRTDWMLNQEVFSSINQLWGPLEVDLFATRLSAQLKRFYSWKPEPQAERVDAFLQDWSTVRGYAHPPWCLISRCLKKAKDQQATLVLITPNWSAQPWFPVALMMSIDYPRCLPRQDNLLVATANADPPLMPTLPNLVHGSFQEIPH